MARGINKVILIGNLGKDPECRQSQQGGTITNLALATDESYKDKNSGQMVPKTEWHRVVMFNRLAEVAKDYLRKGSKIYIEGKLQTRKWQDQSGQDRYTTEIIANEMQMLDSKTAQPQGGQYQQAPAHQQAPQSQQAPQTPERGSHSHGVPTGYKQPYEPPNMAPATDDFDDDIPF